MNTLEAYSIESPSGKLEECAKFVIDDIQSVFVLSNIASIGQEYTFSLWTKSDSEGNITIYGTTIPVTNEWSKHILTFIALEKDVSICFDTASTYFIYNPKLEIGNTATDWTPAPEDIDDKLNATVEVSNSTTEQLNILRNTVSELYIETDGITATVNDAVTTLGDVSGKLYSAQEELSELKLTANQLDIQFQEISNNGVSKVYTETGFTFDREGMTVDSTDSPTKTQVTPDGMTVYKKDAEGEQSEVLEATSEGVDATNLHAKTYLIVGGRSRFENYGTNRTGCFWIGG